MSKFWILAGPHRGKWINVTRYKRHASGVEIKIEHNVPKAAGKQLRWVQTITENGSFFKSCRRRSYVDPFAPTGVVDAKGRAVCRADDNKPFYWTDAEFTGGQGPGFYDKPSESTPSKGRAWIQFVTSLAEVTGKNVVLLATIAWGFDRLASGKVKVAAKRRASYAEARGHRAALGKMYPTYKFSVAK